MLTGGLGGAEGANNLASQGSLTYDPGHRLLFAVNAGSDTISVLSVEGSRVRLDQVLSSRGEFPNSVAVHGNLVYVANAGGAGWCRGSGSSGSSWCRSRLGQVTGPRRHQPVELPRWSRSGHLQPERLGAAGQHQGGHQLDRCLPGRCIWPSLGNAGRHPR